MAGGAAGWFKRGTHHGEFMGSKGSGRAFAIDGVDILRVEGGKLREH